MNTVKPQKIFQKTRERALHVPSRLCAADECLVVFVTQNRESYFKGLNLLEKVKISRMFSKLYCTG